ncbi:MAG: substrate-binding domain-containing protein [Erysipelotrichaceae bacterium]|nr:substrate-binding domain-containing protein [Erysipelotrichaceae bacterium]
MKKISTLIFALLLVACLGLTACNSGTTPAPSATPEASTETTAPAETKEPEQKSSGLSKATVLDASELPITGIGTTVATEVKASGDYKIGYIAKNTTNPYMNAQSAGVAKAGEDMGFEAICQAPSTADSVEEQVRIMENMIEQGCNAIIVHCADSNGIMPGVRAAEDAGVIVLTIGTPAAEDTFLRTGVDYYETGYTIATEMAEALNGEGNIIILEGPPGAANAIERLNGINDAFAKYPNIKIVASQTANFKRTEGMSVTENLLQGNSDIQGIIGANDESALGAVQALKGAGIEGVLVSGFDGSVDASNAVLNGDMFETYNTDPYGSGYIAAAYAVQYLNDGTEPVGRFIPFPTANNDPLINAETVDGYINGNAWFNALQ